MKSVSDDNPAYFRKLFDLSDDKGNTEYSKPNSQHHVDQTVK